MKKILLSSGCSFTSELWSWPNHLSKILNVNLLNTAMLSQGNGLISRKLIYNVDKLLKEYKSEEILIGVMWSGVNRSDYYTTSTVNTSEWGYYEKKDNIKIPTSIIENKYNWQIINSHWNSDDVRLYYSTFHTDIFAMIQSIEHILRVQWYLDKLNIKYFMSTYMNIFNDDIIKNDEIEYLFKYINFDKFLPINGCYEWIKERLPNDGINTYDNHPTNLGQEIFTKEIIIPYLEKNNII